MMKRPNLNYYNRTYYDRDPLSLIFSQWGSVSTVAPSSSVRFPYTAQTYSFVLSRFKGWISLSSDLQVFVKHNNPFPDSDFNR